MYFFVEGEKDADNLSKIGVCATTIAGGAGKWRKRYEDYFKDADLILVPTMIDLVEKEWQK